MKNNSVAFRSLEDGEKISAGLKWIPFHMIFDIMCDFTCKTQFVARGHWTDVPSQITYSTIMMCNSVHIAFLITALNELDC
jgi:hypothetical protein